jgi:hypothetical protein
VRDAGCGSREGCVLAFTRAARAGDLCRGASRRSPGERSRAWAHPAPRISHHRTRYHGPRATHHGPRTPDHAPRTTHPGPRTPDHGPRTTRHAPRTTTVSYHSPDETRGRRHPPARRERGRRVCILRDPPGAELPGLHRERRRRIGPRRYVRGNRVVQRRHRAEERLDARLSAARRGLSASERSPDGTARPARGVRARSDRAAPAGAARRRECDAAAVRPRGPAISGLSRH